MCLDELLAGFSGSSPMLKVNTSKPNPIGHNLNMSAIKLHGRPYVIAIIANHPVFHEGSPSTTQIVEHLDSWLPRDEELHYTLDCYYNTKGVRDHFYHSSQKFTMAARESWAPHVWATLDDKLPEDRWRMFAHEDTESIWSSYHSERIVHTVSTNVQPVKSLADADPNLPPLPFVMYCQGFNVVDLFNRLFYRYPFPHRHMHWMHHIFYCFLKISLVNSWVYFLASNLENNISLRDFMSQVSEELLNQ